MLKLARVTIETSTPLLGMFKNKKYLKVIKENRLLTFLFEIKIGITNRALEFIFGFAQNCIG